MKITITHCRYAPRWETLENVVREATNNAKATLIGISRDDGGCDYHSPGTYSLKFRQGNDTVLPVCLTVVAVGKGA